MKTGYYNSYTKSNYSRGAMRNRDTIFEGLKAPNCIICSKTLERKQYQNGTVEDIKKFLNRKTCGKYYDNKTNVYRMTKCMSEYFKGKNNPNWKGGFPKCIECGNDTAWYRNKNIKKNGHTNPQNYCIICYKKRLSEISKSDKRRQQERLTVKSKLSDYWFKKGHIPYNKINKN
jgi:hypothetical protein